MNAATYLKEHTKTLHQQTEAVAYGQEILSLSLQPELYADLISKNYYIHRHLDDSLVHAMRNCTIVELSDLFKSRTLLLYQDMELLSLSPPSYSYKAPVYQNTSALLGGLYVILGSALGGQIIHRALKQNTNLSAIPHFYFFAAARQTSGKNWPHFCQLLDRHLQTEAQLKMAGEAASATFQFFHSVYAYRSKQEVGFNV